MAKAKVPAKAKGPAKATPVATPSTPGQQLDAFIDAYIPEVAACARGALETLRPIFAGFGELVYDNYNALAIGWTPTGRTSDVVCSIALYPRWVSLFFMKGAALPDPEHRLTGDGKTVRHVVLAAGPRTLDQPAIRALIRHAIDAAPALPRDSAGGIVIKSVSPNQRPRRPTTRVR